MGIIPNDFISFVKNNHIFKIILKSEGLNDFLTSVSSSKCYRSYWVTSKTPAEVTLLEEYRTLSHPPSHTHSHNTLRTNHCSQTRTHTHTHYYYTSTKPLPTHTLLHFHRPTVHTHTHTHTHTPLPTHFHPPTAHTQTLTQAYLHPYRRAYVTEKHYVCIPASGPV